MLKRIALLFLVLLLVSIAVGCNRGPSDGEGMEMEETAQPSDDSESEPNVAATDTPAAPIGDSLKGIGREGSALGASSTVDEAAETPLRPLGPRGSDRLPGACGCAG